MRRQVNFMLESKMNAELSQAVIVPDEVKME